VSHTSSNSGQECAIAVWSAGGITGTSVKSIYGDTITGNVMDTTIGATGWTGTGVGVIVAGANTGTNSLTFSNTGSRWTTFVEDFDFNFNTDSVFGGVHVIGASNGSGSFVSDVTFSTGTHTFPAYAGAVFQ